MVGCDADGGAADVVGDADRVGPCHQERATLSKGPRSEPLSARRVGTYDTNRRTLGCPPLRFD
jgi:hypothetical protein